MNSLKHLGAKYRSVCLVENAQHRTAIESSRGACSGVPNKMAVTRARKKLVDAKLVTIERDEATVTPKGDKLLSQGVTLNAASHQ